MRLLAFSAKRFKCGSPQQRINAFRFCRSVPPRREANLRVLSDLQVANSLRVREGVPQRWVELDFPFPQLLFREKICIWISKDSLRMPHATNSNAPLRWTQAVLPGSPGRRSAKSHYARWEVFSRMHRAQGIKRELHEFSRVADAPRYAARLAEKLRLAPWHSARISWFAHT